MSTYIPTRPDAQPPADPAAPYNARLLDRLSGVYSRVVTKLANEHDCAPYGSTEGWEPVAADTAQRTQPVCRSEARYVCRECGLVWRGTA